MKITKTPAITFIVLCSAFLSIGAASHAAAQPANIALGRSVTLSKPSTEPYTKDKSASQLTDGKYSGADYDEENQAATLWVQKGALTWRVGKEPIIVTIDLGEVKPISGVSFSTAAGTAGVQFPAFIGILVSDDGNSWRYVGNLIQLSRKNGIPELDHYLKFRYVTHDLKTTGRFIALGIRQRPYTVMDEIEVYAGDDSWLNLPPSGQNIGALNEAAVTKIADESAIGDYIQRRVFLDIQAARKTLADTKLSAAQKANFTARLDKAAQENEATPEDTQDGKTILPINATHRAVMSVYGELLAAQGAMPLTVWKQHRYAWLPFMARPEKNSQPAIAISMLKNQFRSDAILLTNASAQKKTVTLQLQNPPAKAGAGWLKMDAVEWTDTYQGIPVADALVPLKGAQGKYQVSIPAGFTRKVWLTVDSSKVPSGKYTSTLLVDKTKVPLRLTVSKLAMQRPRMSLTMWDNSDSKSLAGVASRGITPSNKAAALAMMKSHFVDAPWADRPILPWPKAEDFDAQNKLQKPLDFAVLDQWMAEWPQARVFFVFVSVHKEEGFCGAPLGSDQFNARLGEYARVLAAHMKDKGVSPAKLSLLLFDEPGGHGSEDWQDDLIATWAQAIKTGAPELGLNSDPTWKRPDLQKNQQAITLMDILIPNTQIYYAAPPEVHDYFQKQRADGRELWLYSATGPVRLFDPQKYYRGQAWRVFSIGGRGMGFWAFCDISGAPTAWNDYQISTSFSPAFLDKTTVYNSIHWDSVREGVEDYEELAMLQDAMKSSKKPELKARAQAVLDEALKAVTAMGSTERWQQETNPELTDEHLQKVRAMLEQLRE
jgi:hypothetical protein